MCVGGVYIVCLCNHAKNERSHIRGDHIGSANEAGEWSERENMELVSYTFTT